MTCTSHTHFQNDTNLQNVSQAKYLGITLDEKASNKPDLSKRITDTLATITALKYFWTSSSKASWKLLVFNAVVGAKILYGLESLQLLDGDYQRLDAFQQRGLRRILGFPPTFIDRTNTNKAVLEAAGKALSKKNKTVKIETFSETIKRRAISLLGHIVRLPTEDPMKQTSLRRNKPLYPAAKRVGRPKLNWAKETYNNAWTSAKATDPNTPGIEFKATNEQHDYLIHQAELRLPPPPPLTPRNQEPPTLMRWSH